MKCHVTTTELPDGRFRHATRCGVIRETTQPRFVRPCAGDLCGRWAREHPLEAYAGRPGAMLTHLFSELGIVNGRCCRCRGRAAKMDDWGVAGCRAHRQTIVAWLRQDRRRYSLRAHVVALIRAVRSGLAFRLKVLAPLESLVDEAIRRAEVFAAASSESSSEAAGAIGPAADGSPTKGATSR